MAKQQESKKNILKILLPKVVTSGVLAFQNHQQVVQKNHKQDSLKGSVKMIPDEARRISNHRGSSGDDPTTKSLEPTSPTVSCMGQIKCKKHQCRYQRHMRKKAKSKLKRSASEGDCKQQTSTFRWIFWRRGGTESSSPDSSEAHGVSAFATPPALSQIKRLESRRGALANFDWKAHVVAPEEDDQDHRTIIISFSEPIVPLRPKTEINLWKRRNISRPPPLRSDLI